MNRLSKVLGSIILLCLTACASQQTRVTQAPEIEKISPAELEAMIPAAKASVTLEELVADAKQGKTPDEIIAKIKATNSRYELTPAQTLALSKQGLDVKVLDYMHQANETARQSAIAEAMNERQMEQAEKARLLKRQRDLARMRAFDPWMYGGPWFGPWGPRYYYRFAPGWRYGW